jgi:hypothetical protein
MEKKFAKNGEDKQTSRSASSDLDNPQDFGSNSDRLSAMKNAHALDKVTSVSQMISVVKTRKLPEFYGKDKNLDALARLQTFINDQDSKEADAFGSFNATDEKLVRALNDDKVIPGHLSPTVHEWLKKAEKSRSGPASLD